MSRSRRRALLASGLVLGCLAGGCGAPQAPDDERLGRPYADGSPWNTPIDPAAPVHPDSARLVRAVGARLTSDPTQYTMPVYEVSAGTPRVPVRVTGRFSEVTDGGQEVDALRDTEVTVPLPSRAQPAPGSDGQVVVVDVSTGDEWGLWRARPGDAGWTATNGYHYSVRWSGVPPTGFGSRGAGLPYLAGLVRPRELAAGRIEHAVAFGFPHPSCAFTPPATKSDGQADPAASLPEGARLQLDPRFGEADFDRWGLDRTGRLIARALQTYGMIVVDVSGRPKVYLEAQRTALWDRSVGATTVSGIPLDDFRVLDFRGHLSTASCHRGDALRPARRAPTGAAGPGRAGS